MQKATHDFDYITHILNLKPTRICAMTSKQIFKGNKPAGLKCVDCSEQDVCPESGPLKRKMKEVVCGEYFCFAEDTGNEDSGSAIIRYETGMHVNYTQNFFGRNNPTRGARFLGYRGELELEFQKNELKVTMNHSKDTEIHYVGVGKEGHAGGDAQLAQNFIEVMQRKSKSISPLEGGLLSALTCIKARESDKTNTFQEIKWD